MALLETATEQQLRAQLEKVVSERKAAEALNRRRRLEAIREHAQTFLLLAPDHDRTSCSDNNPCNSFEGCARCILLKPDTLYDEFDVNLSFRRVRDEEY